MAEISRINDFPNNSKKNIKQTNLQTLYYMSKKTRTRHQFIYIYCSFNFFHFDTENNENKYAQKF
jgi:hypothetical protein